MQAVEEFNYTVHTDQMVDRPSLEPATVNLPF